MRKLPAKQKAKNAHNQGAEPGPAPGAQVHQDKETDGTDSAKRTSTWPLRRMRLPRGTQGPHSSVPHPSLYGQQHNGTVSPGLLDNKRVEDFIVILPFCNDDLKCAIGLLNRHAAMRAPKIASLVLMPDNVSENDMRLPVALAKAISDRLRIEPQDRYNGEKKWPIGPGVAFLSAYRVAQKYKAKSWLFLEADCVPVTPDWLEKIIEAYAKCGKPFMGPCTICQPPLPQLCVNGVAVYPGTIGEKIIDSIRVDLGKPFDIVLSRMSQNDIAPTQLMQFALLKDRKPVEWTGRHQIRRGAVLVHGDKTGKLFGVLMDDISTKEPVMPEPVKETPAQVEQPMHVPGYRQSVQWDKGADVQKSFFHSGDLGDIIYSLPLIKWLGGGSITIGPATGNPPFATREPMTMRRFMLIRKLLEKQPYVTSVSFAKKKPRGATDINVFRKLIWGANFEHHKHWRLSALQLKSMSIPTWADSTPWLWAQPKDDAPEVVFARSSRYHNRDFDMAALVKHYDGSCGFIGTEDEHAAFVKECGNIPFFRTDNLWEAASIIAGCQLFIGNQSSPLAIAVGLGKPCIVEEAMQTQNCCFNYPGFQYGERCEPPTLRKRPLIEWRALTDANSGIGRWSLEVARRFSRVKLRWVPTRREESHTPHPFDSEKSATDDRQRVIFDALPLVLKHINSGDIVITIWESDELPDGAAPILNRAKCLIVPSVFCETLFRTNGVTVPIHRIDLGIDEALSDTVPSTRPTRPIIFGCATRCSKPSLARKNTDLVIAAFTKAVPSDGSAILELKGYDGAWEHVPDDARFKCISEYYTDKQLLAWYNRLHFIINIATGGWELHAHEAMACGVVPIVIDRGGVVEFTDAGNSIIVKSRQEEARDGIHSSCGKWWVPDKHGLRDAITSALHMEQSKWCSMSGAARASALRYTWQRTSEWIEDIILSYT